MTIELTAVEMLRLSYLLSVAKENTMQNDCIETAEKIKLQIVENIDLMQKSVNEFLIEQNKVL